MRTLVRTAIAAAVLVAANAIILAEGPTTAGPVGWKASGKGGAVAAGGGKAVLAGLAVLKNNGNAADAAAATILALSVTDYGSFCIGGEVPLMIYDAKKKEVKVLCGLGRAPTDPKATAWLLANGIPTTRDKDNLKSACVPAVIDLCSTVLKLYGTMKFEDVVTATLAILDKSNKAWHADLGRTLRKLVAAERKFPSDRLKGLQAVSDRFYRGDVADELDAWYRANGGFLRKKDLAAHVTRVEDAVSVTYRGYTVYKCDTWTQGPVLCQALGLLEGFDLKRMGPLSADYIHVVCEAMKLALADRDRYYADPLFRKVPIKKLLSDEYARLRRPLIDMRRASRQIRPGDPVAGKPLVRPYVRPGSGGPRRDTTTCVVADRWGNVVAATPSGWGSKASTGGKTGVTHGTRMISLNNWKGHPNCVEPGKRPRITLTPTLVTRDGKPLLAVSVAGGDLQDQTTLNLLLQFVEFGALPDRAVTAGRFATRHHVGSFSQTPPKLGSLTVHHSVAKEVIAALRGRGHGVSVARGAIAAPVMLYIDPKSGMIHAAGDPAARRHAAALDPKRGQVPFSAQNCQQAQKALEKALKMRIISSAARKRYLTPFWQNQKCQSGDCGQCPLCVYYTATMRTLVRTAIGAAVLVAANATILAEGPVMAGPDLKSLDPPVLLPNGREFKTWQPSLKFSKTYYVDGSAAAASDENPGTKARPFRTINRAAQVLQPGQRAIVAAGVYREWVRPKRGGTSPAKMISYQAAPGAKVVIRGSRVVKGKWEASAAAKGLWKAPLGLEYFDDYNPFTIPNVTDKQFDGMSWARPLRGKKPYTLPRGLVFQNGRRLQQVYTSEALAGQAGAYWVTPKGRMLHINPFGGKNPNGLTMEITTQRCIFAPQKIGLGYIHVKGFIIEHSGNGFPMPQYGALSTWRGHHWLIEDNTVRQVNGVGIDIGKQYWALPQPKVAPGGHIVRRNTVTDCGVCGIQGMASRDNLIEDNLLVGNAIYPVERYWETGGIKTHGNVNTLIRRNRILDTHHGPGIWMDFANVNSRCSQNVVVGSRTVNGAIFIEASLRPNMIDHNIVWDTRGAGIYEHDCRGQIICHNFVGRSTGPAVYLRGKVTNRRVGGEPIVSGGHTVVNNVFFANKEDIRTKDKQRDLANNLTDGVVAGFDRKTLTLTWHVTGRLPQCRPVKGVTHDFFGKVRPPAPPPPGPFAKLPAKSTAVKLTK